MQVEFCMLANYRDILYKLFIFNNKIEVEMKLEQFTFDIYVAILDIYIEVCGCRFLAGLMKNQQKYDKIISDLTTRSSIELRLGSTVCNFSKVWIHKNYNGDISFSFESEAPLKGDYDEKKKEIEQKLNARIAEFLSITEVLQKIERTEKHQFSCENHYVFGFNYNGGTPNEVIVEKPTEINNDSILFHFLSDHRSISEYIRKEDIIAFGDEDGAFEIEGWSGRYTITILNKKEFINLIKSGALKVTKCYGFVEFD